MGNGFSVVANFSSKKHDVAIGPPDAGDNDTMTKITHTGVGLAYAAGDLTVAVNAGSKKTKGFRS